MAKRSMVHLEQFAEGPLDHKNLINRQRCKENAKFPKFCIVQLLYTGYYEKKRTGLIGLESK